MSKYLTKELIIKSDDITKEEVEVSEWGGTVLVKGMTGTERDTYEFSIINQDGKDIKVNYENARAKLIAKCIIDEDGNRLFTDEDISILGKKSSIALDRVFSVAQKLCGIGKKEIDELIKN